MTKYLLEHDPEELWAQWNADPKTLLRRESLQKGFDIVAAHTSSFTTAASFIRITVRALGKGDTGAGAQKLGWASDGELYSALHRCVEKAADG
ncbi:MULTISPECIES: hypothetical protein [Corynebacterium]|uniref:hypothetical protein n=1 Tax=Corynebacterium TaxID=1716 RepID=UPI00254380AF|nr:hypothetical protein [Corynebacterium accolens]MDK4295477.1 hypothetical protein [Corynebacterium accolens]